ncbi:MAG TPA: hypothetical protein VEH31_08845, partial [Streptosporangiaceae bacterium]|nr:hypothetical protein [Streptosporangiaceae bacterium]
MSQHHGDYEDFLRGALHAAVDSVEPAGDGLERIRGRLAPPRPLLVAWLAAMCSWVARRARGSLDSVSAWLQTVPRSSGRPGGAGGRDRATGHQRQLARLRLVAAVAAVTVLMALSVSTLTPFGRQMLSQAGAVLSSIGGGEPAGTGEPGTSGNGSGAAGVTGATQGGQNPAQPAASCTPGPSALAVPPPGTGPASPGSAAGSSPASPGSPAGSSPASPPADSTGTDSTGTDSTGTDSTGTDSTPPSSPPADSTGTDSASPSSPPPASPAPAASPSPAPSTPAGASAASP